MKNLLFIILFASLLFTGCKDKPSGPITPCTSCQTVMEGKDFFFFKVGSWWVYEEQTSHLRDSMYVTEAGENVAGYQFDVRMVSSRTNYTYHYWPEYYSINNNCTNSAGGMINRCLYVKRSKYGPQGHLGESTVFFARYKINDIAYTPSDPISQQTNVLTLTQILDSYNNSGNSFGKTVVVSQTHDYWEGRQPSVVYHSKNVGIVRKELIDSNQVWNLVDYHIEE